MSARRSAPGRRRWHGTALRRAVALAPLALGACAYFNGVYNAKASARAADKLARQGRTEQAEGAYALAAEKAETVLARYPHTRWRPDALYVAGRSLAMIGRCGPAEARLTEYLALPHRSSATRSRATLALGGCFVRSDRITDGQRLLEPLVHLRDKEVARQAALWMARAAIAMGATDVAQRYLSGLPAAAAQWELAAASLERGQFARAESLFVLRGRQGDYRDEVATALRTLWSARRYDGVERVVGAYAGGRAPTSAKITLHILASDLLESEARDSAARVHLLRAQSLAVDSSSTREVAARLCRLQVADAHSAADAEGLVTRCATRARGAPLYLRLQDNLLLVRLLESRPDFSGTSLFLAGEVARDSLRAPRLAQAIFARIADAYPNALVTPKALLAAGAILPESAEVYRERVRARYPRSPYTVLLAGGDPSDLASYQTVEEALRKGWADGVAMLTDSVGKLRPPPAAAVSTSGARPERAAAPPARAPERPAGATPAADTTVPPGGGAGSARP